MKLVCDLNEGRRFLALSLGSGNNEEGARSVSTWKAGYATSTSFALGAPEALPENARRRSENPFAGFDVVVAFGALPPSPETLPLDSTDQRPYLIHIASREIPNGLEADVLIRRPQLGIDESGTIMRGDGVMLSVEAPFANGGPTLLEILSLFETRIREGGRL